MDLLTGHPSHTAALQGHPALCDGGLFSFPLLRRELHLPFDRLCPALPHGPLQRVRAYVTRHQRTMKQKFDLSACVSLTYGPQIGLGGKAKSGGATTSPLCPIPAGEGFLFSQLPEVSPCVSTKVDAMPFERMSCSATGECWMEPRRPLRTLEALLSAMETDSLLPKAAETLRHQTQDQLGDSLTSIMKHDPCQSYSHKELAKISSSLSHTLIANFSS
ncbi:hypothetical protein QQF64_036186 [Cirrhinus molitorella]|uniref:Uncharacterized protein n=1 Tax=Cirrhinus molitorella TaxID=172907 RepID=A0ABR3NIQ3_9TELE